MLALSTYFLNIPRTYACVYTLIRDFVLELTDLDQHCLQYTYNNEYIQFVLTLDKPLYVIIPQPGIFVRKGIALYLSTNESDNSC